MIPCKKCNAQVFWVMMQVSGKNNLLDAEPSTTGDIVVVEGTKPLIAHTVSPREWPDNPVRYTSHFRTCPSSPITEELRMRGRGMRA